MFRSQLIELAMQGLIQVLIISAPPVLISLLFGLTVAVFQAATQIQENALAFAVKLVAIMVTLLLVGGGMGRQALAVAHYIFSNFPKWTTYF